MPRIRMVLASFFPSFPAVILLGALLVASQPLVGRAELRVGAAIVDVTPVEFPVLVNGGMLSNSAAKVKTPLNARAVCLDDGRERIAIVVVDSCMIGRPLCDEIKQLAAEQTKLRPNRILISATHTHTAAAAMGCLGTDADPRYVPFLRLKVAEAIVRAEQRLEPARVGWGVGDAAEFTALRQWVRRPDRLEKDPFGNFSVRANMHAGRNWDDATGEAGPEDPDLSLISFQAKDGRPLAILANFSMHYFSDSPISADYFGLFCAGLEQAIAKRAAAATRAEASPFVGIMSHGCSGDIWRRDYTRPIPAPADDFTIDTYAAGLLQIALATYDKIEHRDVSDIAMSERRMTLNYRVPDLQRLEWARRIVEAMGDRPPKDTTEVYAREQILLHERQSTEIVVQGIRIGDIGIATTPNETYALTGLKLKLQSPLAKTMVIELANGGDGYIPPAEQHPLGGYNTWAARSAGLEVGAEAKIVAAGLEQLEKVAGLPRRRHQASAGPAAQAILSAKPVAYWRLDEMGPPRARDASGSQRDAFFEPGVLFFLEGPHSDRFSLAGEKNRAAFFAGGRLTARVDALKENYSISFWFWNGMPTTARPVTGWLFGRGDDQGVSARSESLGLGGIVEGNSERQGKLWFVGGDDRDGAPGHAGRTEIARWTWHHVTLVREGRRVRVFLDGDPQPEIDVPDVVSPSESLAESLFFGGRAESQDSWEGRLDEIAVFDRALTLAEIARLAK
ncbi:MAG: LamG domain-containing protein [Pirellulales bacterium]